ncbi:hypothetical protein DOTSEDRAFT_74428 [Dothistroma septosporum NZE10]|uniref:DUF7587 domain-containing protein n=1 Tax=Dothistroma septosporum (strain NZE10 / CBS 128990) TaxID=675120 RepID=N1PHS1_DOTSN|nr:hypothetical protein DOTSEDRAFT_74428 [Dothistroma septosporum NZE10]
MSPHVKLFALPRPSLHHLHDYSAFNERRASQANLRARSVVLGGIGTFPILPQRHSEAMVSPPAAVLRQISTKGKEPVRNNDALKRNDSKASSSRNRIGSHYFPEGLEKPKCFWRVTDSTSLTRIDREGNFDTKCQLWGHWSFWTSMINIPNLNAQIDWYHRFTLTTVDGDGDDPPLFVSVTADSGWAYDEFDRRARRRRDQVRINVIDTSSFEWEVVFLENGEKLPVLREQETGCTMFSSEAASKALNWHHRYRNSREWFAVKWIPERFISPEVWSND